MKHRKENRMKFSSVRTFQIKKRAPSWDPFRISSWDQLRLSDSEVSDAISQTRWHHIDDHIGCLTNH